MKSFFKRVGKYVGYPLFFIFFLLLFAYWTFPYDRVRDFIVQEVERPMGPGGRRVPSGYTLEIVDLSPSWLTGVDLTGVRLVKAAEEPDQQPTDVTFEHVHARVGLFALLGGTTAVSFDTRVGGGTIEGEVEQSEEKVHAEVAIDGVNLRRIGLLRSYTQLPIGGRLTGDVDLTVAQDPAQTAGSIALSLEGLTIGDGNAKIRGLTVDRVNGGNLELQLEVDAGSAVIKKLEGRGEDLELDGAGAIALALPVERSRLNNVMVRAKISDGYKERSERASTILELLQLDPRMRAAFTPDGALQFRISGVLGAATTTPAGRSPAPGQ